MNVFISWSGETSKALAKILNNWIPNVIQAVNTWYSQDDISKGSRWLTEISQKLEQFQIGLICLTRDNLEAPWIMFEAGALSKNLDKSHICPILFGIEPTDVKGPLVQFQASRFEKEDFKRVLNTINMALGDDALKNNVLNETFNIFWPKLEEKVKEAMKSQNNNIFEDVRSERDLLIEILELQRKSVRLYNEAPITRFQLSVDELELSVKTHNILKAANIETIGELVQREEEEMLRFRDMGEKELGELKDELKRLHVNFKEGSNKF